VLSVNNILKYQVTFSLNSLLHYFSIDSDCSLVTAGNLTEQCTYICLLIAHLLRAVKSASASTRLQTCTTSSHSISFSFFF